MATLLSKRIQKLEYSPILALDAHVKQLQAEGIAVISLAIGEPNFETPVNIKARAIESIQQGFTHYTPSAGIPKLRAAIAHKLNTENHIPYTPQEVIAAVGSKNILFLALSSLCQTGDEVIIPTPTWTTYVEQTKLAGATPVLLALKPPFSLTANALEKAITKKTKVIIMNYPCNPTGRTIDKDELQKIAKVVLKHNLFIISDEIYEKIMYGKTKHTSLASLGEEIRQHTLTVNGFSKSYAMTGWRIGYGAGPQDLIAAMTSLASQITAGTSSISQMAALEALEGSQESVKQMAKEFEKRMKFVYTSLSSIKKISVVEPQGAFYLFFDISKLLGKKYKTSTDWTNALLEIKRIALVPGEAFCAPGFVRLSYASSLQQLEKGMEAIKEFVSENS